MYMYTVLISNYSNAYTLVLHKQGKRLYTTLKDVIKEHLLKEVSSLAYMCRCFLYTCSLSNKIMQSWCHNVTVIIVGWVCTLIMSEFVHIVSPSKFIFEHTLAVCLYCFSIKGEHVFIVHMYIVQLWNYSWLCSICTYVHLFMYTALYRSSMLCYYF